MVSYDFSPYGSVTPLATPLHAGTRRYVTHRQPGCLNQSARGMTAAACRTGELHVGTKVRMCLPEGFVGRQVGGDRSTRKCGMWTVDLADL
jgi:hypothetical protein